MGAESGQLRSFSKFLQLWFSDVEPWSTVERRSMISRVPGLELMQHLAGTYAAAGNSVQLQIERCGYGFALVLRSDAKLELSGVVGAAGQSELECYAVVGLPNLVRIVGRQPTNSSLKFSSDDAPLDLLLEDSPGGATATLRLGARGDFELWRLPA
jgi:hypothetical protein